MPILSDPRTMSFWPRPLAYDEVVAWIDANLRRYTDDGFGRYAVIHRQSQALIGDAGIVISTIDSQRVHDLGYIIAAPYWRRGFASEATRALLCYGFDVLGIDALYANMATDHIGSQRVAEKLGMRRVKQFNNPRNRNLPTYLYMIERRA